MPGIYILTHDGRALLQDRFAGEFWINGTWDTVDVLYVGF
jgi:hypothetical protein